MFDKVPDRREIFTANFFADCISVAVIYNKLKIDGV